MEGKYWLHSCGKSQVFLLRGTVGREEDLLRNYGFQKGSERSAVIIKRKDT